MSNKVGWYAAIIMMCVVAVLATLLSVRSGKLRKQQPLPAQKEIWAAPAPPVDLERQYELVDTIASGLKELRAITIDKNDDLYLAGADAVKVMSAEGKLLREWPLSQAATAIALDAEGMVYLAERNRIEVFDRKGELLRTWGKEGAAPGELDTVTGLTIGGTNVVIADAGNRRIHRFDTTGDFIDDIGRRDVENNVDGIVCPSPFLDVVMDRDGVLFVTNPGRSRVEQYKIDGTLLRFWGTAGNLPDHFFGCCNPTNLVFLPDGNLVTAEKGRIRVKVYDTAGKMLAYVGPEHFSKHAAGLDLAVDSKGRIAVIDPGNGKVSIFALKQAPPPAN